MKEKEPVFSDDDVVRSVQEGRTQDFELLIERYKKKIINFIHKMIYDFDEAQSLSQDAFLKVFENLGQYRAQDNFQAFLFTIAKNITLNYLKKQKRVLFFSNFFPGFTGFPGTGTAAAAEDESGDGYFHCPGSQEEILEKKQQDEILTEALKSLKENQRIALILKVYLEFSYRQISDITGWSEPKIETLISRAKNNLIDKIRFPGSEKPPKKLPKQMQEINRNNVLKVRSI